LENTKVENNTASHLESEIQDNLTNEGVGKESTIYTSRFSPAQEKVRNDTWDVLVSEFFQQYVKPNDRVLDLGAGDGLFITKIKSGKKIAVDLSSHVNKLKEQGIEVLQVLATDFADRLDAPVDVIFMSNFLEHLPDKRTLIQVFEECHKALAPNGKIMILQPNIRYAGVQYWDYVDHHIALTEFSLVEGLEVTGYKVKKLIPQFLPYTAKSKVGSISSLFSTRALVSNYLKIPLLWKLFGAQTFVLAEKVG